MSPPSIESRDRIRHFVLESLAPGHGVTSVADSDSLVTTGLVDSMGIFRLVDFLETTFGIRIAADEILQENFRTIDAIEAYVARKSGDSGR